MDSQFLFSSSVTDLSEEQDYLTLRNRICFFNSANLNKVQMDYDESTLEQCQSLVNMPVVCRYVKRNGKDDLGGHEVSIENGRMKFNTATVGVVTSVEIKQEDVETVSGEVMNLPVLYADERIWTRNENVANAIKRLHSDGRLYSSWEVKSSEYFFKDSIKHLTCYQFLANCLLGTSSYPAYGAACSKVLDVSETPDNYEYLAAESLLSEALALDLESASASNINLNQLEDSAKQDDTNRKEVLSMDVNENVVVETSEEKAEENTVEVVQAEETAEVKSDEAVDNEVAEASDDVTAEESTTDENEESNVESSESEEANGEGEVDKSEEEVAMNTQRDINRMIRNALNEGNTEDYMDIAFVFPEDKIVLVQSWRMKELEFVQYSYRVEGDKVVLEDEKKVELVVSPLQINSEIESKNNAIAEANNRIVELENQNAELIKIKEEYDKIKAEQAETEHSEAVNKLREYVVKSGRFTDEEIASEEIQKAINDLNETWLKAEIADRLVASFAESKNSNVETSEAKKDKTNIAIVLSGEEKNVTADDVIKAFFNRED